MGNILKRILLTFVLFAFSVGISAAENASRDDAVGLVKKAVEYIKKHGKENSLAELSNTQGQFRDRDLYILGYNMQGINMVHGANNKLIGKNLYDLKDADNKFFIQEFIKVAKSKTGNGWVDYKWVNPTTKEIEQKSTYIFRVDDDFFIGCGVYRKS